MALNLTGNKSVEAAFMRISPATLGGEFSSVSGPNEYLLEDNEEEWVDIDDIEESNSDQISSYPKMVLIVNSELKMKPGKIAAQVGHAVLDLYRKLKSRGTPKQRANLGLWASYGEKMVVVKGNNTQHLRDLRALAESKRLSCNTVSDAGRTQVDEGAETILAVFGISKELDELTGSLKLL